MAPVVYGTLFRLYVHVLIVFSIVPFGNLYSQENTFNLKTINPVFFEKSYINTQLVKSDTVLEDWLNDKTQLSNSLSFKVYRLKEDLKTIYVRQTPVSDIFVFDSEKDFREAWTNEFKVDKLESIELDTFFQLIVNNKHRDLKKKCIQSLSNEFQIEESILDGSNESVREIIKYLKRKAYINYNFFIENARLYFYIIYYIGSTIYGDGSWKFRTDKDGNLRPSIIFIQSDDLYINWYRDIDRCFKQSTYDDIMKLLEQINFR